MTCGVSGVWAPLLPDEALVGRLWQPAVSSEQPRLLTPWGGPRAPGPWWEPRWLPSAPPRGAKRCLGIWRLRALPVFPQAQGSAPLGAQQLCVGGGAASGPLSTPWVASSRTAWSRP